MPDELTQLGAREFARHIDELFGKYRIETFSDGPDWVETPVVGLSQMAAALDHSEAILAAKAANK